MKKVRTTCIYYVEEQKVVCDFIAMFLRFIGILVKKSKVRIAGDEEFDLILNLESLEGIQNFHYDAYKDIPLEEKQTYQLLNQISKRLVSNEKGQQELMKIAKIFIMTNLCMNFIKGKMISDIDNVENNYKLSIAEELKEVYKAVEEALKHLNLNSRIIDDYYSYSVLYIQYLRNECIRIFYPMTIHLCLGYDTSEMLKNVDKKLQEFPDFVNLHRLKAYIVEKDKKMNKDNKMYCKYMQDYINEASKYYSKGVRACLGESYYKMALLQLGESSHVNRLKELLSKIWRQRSCILFNDEEYDVEDESLKAINQELEDEYKRIIKEYLQKALEYDGNNYKVYYFIVKACRSMWKEDSEVEIYLKKITELISSKSEFLNPIEQIYLYHTYRMIGDIELRKNSEEHKKSKKYMEELKQSYDSKDTKATEEVLALQRESNKRLKKRLIENYNRALQAYKEALRIYANIHENRKYLEYFPQTEKDEFVNKYKWEYFSIGRELDRIIKILLRKRLYGDKVFDYVKYETIETLLATNCWRDKKEFKRLCSYLDFVSSSR